jgi:hypothetical protein
MRDSELFRVTSPGINGRSGSISFESVLRPGYYIVHKNGYIDVDSFPNTGFDQESCSHFLLKIPLAEQFCAKSRNLGAKVVSHC